MLITPTLLQAYNQIIQDTDEESQELIAIYIGTAQQKINDYVGFDIDEVIAEDSEYTQSQIALFKDTELRIATLLQLESNSNLGVSNSNDIGVSRSYLNVVDYTPYLKQLSAFRKEQGV